MMLRPKYTYNTHGNMLRMLNISDNEKVFVRMDSETIRYQYDNHLGSACLELDEYGYIISYEEYHPFGTTSYRAGRSATEVSWKRYKYCGKERDEETGLYYYGARYYASWLCRFVSVDPLQFKYPELTPFQYCANNPVKFIDPDGKEIKVSGEAMSQVIQQLKATTSQEFNLMVDEKGNISYQGKALTDRDKFLKKAIDSEDITVNLIANRSEKINGKNYFTTLEGKKFSYNGEHSGGAYLGNKLSERINHKIDPANPLILGEESRFEFEKTYTSQAYQYVDPFILENMDNMVDGFSSGLYMLHEVAEGYYGGEIAIINGEASPRDGVNGSTYLKAHKLANKIAGGDFQTVKEFATRTDNEGNPIINTYTGKPIKDEINYYRRIMQ